MENKWINDKCDICGHYENSFNDEESRLDNPENPEYFCVVRSGDECGTIHEDCLNNYD